MSEREGSVEPVVPVAPAFDGELDDATIVAIPDDATIVVPQRSAVEDHTVVVPQRSTPDDRTTTGSHGDTSTDSSASHPVGSPVEERDEIPPGLARLFFKKPLDPKRRAPESPFPKSQSSLPRAGVGGGIPVVYGARSEELPAQAMDTELSRIIGPPPLGYNLPTAEREVLPSTALLNRRFRNIAIGGGLGVLVISATGLWWVTTMLIR